MYLITAADDIIMFSLHYTICTRAITEPETGVWVECQLNVKFRSSNCSGARTRWHTELMAKQREHILLYNCKITHFIAYILITFSLVSFFEKRRKYIQKRNAFMQKYW